VKCSKQTTKQRPGDETPAKRTYNNGRHYHGLSTYHHHHQYHHHHNHNHHHNIIIIITIIIIIILMFSPRGFRSQAMDALTEGLQQKYVHSSTVAQSTLHSLV
jgi:hypothetical protein